MKTRKINKDKIFLHHTGGMFGIGCSAFNLQTIDIINELKQRKSGKGLIVLLADRSWLEKYGITVSPQMNRLLQQYWAGELTVILPDAQNKFKHISVDGQVAFRLPGDPFLQDFIRTFQDPIISTSINLSGETPVDDLNEIRKKYRNWFDLEILPSELPKGNLKPSTIIKEAEGKLVLLREGSIEFAEIERSWQKPRILFVCTANICRSPMAHYYFQWKIEELQLSYEVRSAGFLQSNIRISQNSYETLLENNINASAHLSTQLSEDVIRQSWLILTMTKNHKLSLIEHFPTAENKTFTLSEFTGFQQDIDDPYGLDIFYYRQTFEKIQKRIDILVEKLMNL